MEEENEFPKSAKELYDKLMEVNKLNAIKITMKAVEKLYQFLLEVKEENNHSRICASVEHNNDENEKERKGAHQVSGTCPKCENILSDTGGKENVAPSLKNTTGTRYGRYCLNCGKIYLSEDWRRNVFTETDTPLFSRYILKY